MVASRPLSPCRAATVSPTLSSIVLGLCLCTSAAAQDWSWSFRRGDANGDGILGIADVVVNLEGIFNGGNRACDDAFDANDDGLLSIADAFLMAHFLFLAGAEPAVPFLNCGVDETDDPLDCVGYLSACPPVAAPGPMFMPGLALQGPADPWNWTLQTCDLEGDGDLDILTSGRTAANEGSVHVMRNEGGTFTELAYPLEPNDHVYAIAHGDIDVDGDLDVIAGVRFASHLRILLGAGDGTLAPTPAELGYVSESVVTAVCVGDVNGDGTLDIVSTTTDQRFTNDTEIHVHFGDGSGGFSDDDVYFVWDGAFGFTSFSDSDIGDLDDDGDLDVALSLSLPTGDRLALVLNDGGGGYGAPSLLSVPYDIQVQALADTDNNGGLELVVVGGQNLYRYGVEDGVLDPLSLDVLPEFMAAFSLGDVNGDGNIDMVAGDPINDVMRVLLFAEFGSIVSQGEYFVDTVFQTAVADLDGDGDADVLGLSSDGQVGIFHNQVEP